MTDRKHEQLRSAFDRALDLPRTERATRPGLEDAVALVERPLSPGSPELEIYRETRSTCREALGR